MAKSKNKLELLSLIQSKRAVFALSVALLSLLVIMVVTLATYRYHYRGKIFPNTSLGTLQLGGKTPQEAETAIQGHIEKQSKDFTLFIEGHDPIRFSLSDIGLSYDTAAIARASFFIGRHGSPTQRIADMFRSLFKKNQMRASYQADEGKFNALMETSVSKVGTQAADATIVLNPERIAVIQKEKQGVGITKEDMEEVITLALHRLETDVIIKPTELIPSIVESELVESLAQTKTILSHAPLTLKASDVTVDADIPTVFSWIIFKDAQKTPSPLTSPVSFWQSLIPQVHAATRTITAELDAEKVKDYVGTVAVSVNNDPANAELLAVDGQIKVTQPHVDGEKLIIDEAASLVITSLMQPAAEGRTALTLPVEKIIADVRADTIEALGIKELIGTAETNFKGSPANRVHNINTGSSFLTGVVVPKGQDFSTVKTLGKVDGSTGYLPELVIKENRTIPEYGGGLCQVSTTLFRAVMQAGLKVTERSNHSYRVSYYEPPVGLDATIYLPKPDFKFLNDTPGYILVQSKVEGTKIKFELYGTRDGRVATVSEPVVTDITEPPAPSYTETDTLPKGETKQIEKPHQGATAVATYTVTRDGQEINKQVFRSRYKPWQARFLVGTKEQ